MSHRPLIALSLLTAALGLACTGGSPKPEEAVPVGAEAPEVVAAFTDGTISREAPVRVVFHEDLASADQIGQPLPKSPFTFDKPVKGKAVWVSARELQFQPEADLPGGTAIEATVDLGAVKPDWKGQRFALRFGVLQQGFRAELLGLEADDATGTVQKLPGVITTSDVAEPAEVEALLKATLAGSEPTVTWEHAEDRRTHRFVIRGLRRGETASDLTLAYDGAALGVSEKRDEKVVVPSLADFSVASSRAVTDSDRLIEIRFSDPLLPKQDLRGLVTVSNKRELRFDVEGSVLRISSPEGLTGEHTVKLRGVKNANGRALPEQTLSVSFEPIKPLARFVGEGVIYPTSAGLTVPIETANLRSVVVEAFVVPAANLPQFFQVNAVDGDQELKRVGKVVWRQRVPIEETPDRANRWVRQGLDVSSLVDQNPGGMYRLEMSFERSDVIWDCADGAPETAALAPLSDAWDQPSGESSYWDGWEEGEDAPWTWYDRRKDPCSKGYYHSYWDHSLKATRNVIVSNVGLIAKRGEDGKIFAVATDLRSAQPMPQTKVEVLNYQLETVASGVTAGDGTITLDAPGNPFVVKASAGGQHAWLKLDKGSALSVAHFDTSGAAVVDGLKGTFYAERGVWRPGDDIHLNFVLLDESGRLPADHPVHFELRSPTGAVVERRTLTRHVGNFWPIPTRTAADAPTGTYTARAQVGGRSFTQELRVESVVPNRLKIAMDFGTELLKGPEIALNSVLSARWLHGAKAPGLKSTIELDLKPRPTSFAKFPEHTFGDPMARFEWERQEIFASTLDNEGQVTVDSPIDLPEGSPGLLTASFTTRVFEPSGAFSVDTLSIPVAPHDRYLGVKLPKGDEARGMLLTDVKHPVDLVSVDADGKLAGDGDLKVKLYKLNWRWWWEKGEENLADYVGSGSMRELQSDTVALSGGKATWDLEIKFPEWGRYLLTVEDASGHRAGRVFYADWPGWAGRGQKDNPGGASVLSVTTSAKKVNVGEQVTVNIPTPQGGRALVTLESGTRVVKADWVEPKGEMTAYTFTATPEMAPSVYANVSLVQPHLQAANDLPIRVYGIAPIEVVDPGTKLEPKLVTADVFEPESTVKVSISEGQGRGMTYTLAVVDEGLLGLTRFQTPDPWGAFYRREALGVRTWDVFSHVAGAHGGSLESMIAIGGDGGLADAPPARANRFPPVVMALGPFQLQPGKTDTHELELPPYIGEVRVMVVAGEGRAFGKVDKSVPVKKDLMVLATLPRVLGPQEKFALPVSVFALGDKVKDVTVSVTAEGPVKLVGEAKQKLAFSQPGDKMVSFPLEVADGLGVAKVTVTAEGGGKRAQQVVDIQVRHPGVTEHRTLAASIKPGETWNANLQPFGLAGTNLASVELSRVPPLNLGQRLDYLITYPHGCVEQTTSGAFPQVYLSKLMDLPPEKAAATQANVRAGIERLRAFQTSEGGFGYWAGETTVDDWSTSYVGHFLMEAERAGYLIPASMRSKWVAAQRSRAARWTRGEARSDLAQAYRLYTLALAREPELGAMNRLKESSTLSPEARWRLAAAYHLAGQPEVAKALAAGQSTEVAPYNELTGTYGSDLRDEAMILEALALMGHDPAGTLTLATQVSEALAQNQWMSTQTTSMSLVSLARFAQVGGTSGEIKAKAEVDGGKATRLDSAKTMASASLGARDTAARIAVTNEGSGPVFARLVASGRPPIGQEQALSKGLALEVAYVHAVSGERVNPADLDQGTDFRVQVVVKNTSGRALNELALTQIVPSGWEIHGTAPGKGANWEYRDVRDDRVMTYFDLKPGEARSFEWSLHAAYLGRFWMPAITVEAMYDAGIVGRTPGAWVEVSDASVEG